MSHCPACSGPVNSVCAQDVRDAETAWHRLGPFDQSRWSGRHAWVAIWLMENVLNREVTA